MIKNFSVLIPAYNVERFIDKCLLSVLNQIYTNFEVVIIDDGSTDKTLEICQKYQDNDDRIVVFHQENRGISYTRNKLLEIARGEWVIFIDADDYVKDDLLLRMHSSIKDNRNAEVIVCDYICMEKDNSFKIRKEPFNDKTEYLNKLLCWNSINTALWAKAIKRTFIVEYGIKFEKDITLGEDLCFISRLFYYAREIIYLPQALYVWNRTNINSITSQGKYQYDLVRLYETIVQFYENKDDYEIFNKSLNKSVIRLMEFLYVYRKYTYFGFLPSTIQIKNLSFMESIEFFLIKNKLYKLTCIAEKIRRNINKYLSMLPIKK